MIVRNCRAVRRRRSSYESVCPIVGQRSRDPQQRALMDAPALQRGDSVRISRSVRGGRRDRVGAAENYGWIEGPGPGSRLEIALREPSRVNSLTVQQLQRWVNSVTTSPAEVLRRSKVKDLLGDVAGESGGLL